MQCSCRCARLQSLLIGGWLCRSPSDETKLLAHVFPGLIIWIVHQCMLDLLNSKVWYVQKSLPVLTTSLICITMAQCR